MLFLQMRDRTAGERWQVRNNKTRCRHFHIGKGNALSGVGMECEKYIKEFIPTNIYSPGERNADLRQIFIDLDRFDKNEDECTDSIDRWLYIIKNMKSFHNMPYKEKEEIFRRLEEYAETAKMTPDERLIYDLHVDSLRAYDRGLEYAREKASNKGKCEVAQNLLNMGMPEKDIAKATGLTMEQIKGLRN